MKCHKNLNKKVTSSKTEMLIDTIKKKVKLSFNFRTEEKNESR